MKSQNIFPVYTTIGKKPETICKRIKTDVFDYPFFNQGIRACTINHEKRYSIDEFTPTPSETSLHLKGFIYHTSYCGSTLLSQMLGQIKNVRVVSEPEAINGLLLSYALCDLEENTTIKQLTQIINSFRQPEGEKKYLILKLTSWNVFFIHLFLKAFPQQKWMYIDRDTEHIMNSLSHRNGGFIDWWNHPVDMWRSYFVGVSSEQESKEDYLRKMIEGHRYHAQTHRNENSLFTIYPDFLQSYTENILPHFELYPTIDELKNVLHISKYNSKFVKKELWLPKT